MPSGRSRTGLTVPKTPGSITVDEDTTLIGISRSSGDPARTALRMRHQRINHEKLMPMNPTAHMAIKVVGIRFRAGGTCLTGNGTAETVNGWLTSSMTTYAEDWGTTAAVRK